MADGEDKTSKVIEIQLPPTPKPPKPGFLAFARFFGSGLLIAVSYLDPGKWLCGLCAGLMPPCRWKMDLTRFIT
jgi:hypothetical protein